VFRETPIWRMIHGLIGALTLVALALHTSLSLGPRMELNWPPMSLITLLVIDFLIVALFGAVAGIVHAISPGWPAVTALTRRRRWSGVHLALCWPLPVLVILHVLQVYYY
jgi:nitrite reductase (NADH) large subunit